MFFSSPTCPPLTQANAGLPARALSMGRIDTRREEERGKLKSNKAAWRTPYCFDTEERLAERGHSDGRTKSETDSGAISPLHALTAVK